MERKEARKLLRSVRTVYVLPGPWFVKATKSSVRSLINGPYWVSYKLEKLEEVPDCAVLKKEVGQ